MNIATGCDLEAVARFERLLKKDSFMSGIYTQNEREYIAKASKPEKTAAGIYCAKEAAAKALGRGFFGLLPRELEIVHKQGGAPQLLLHGSAAQQYGHLPCSVSISHSEGFALAVCTFILE